MKLRALTLATALSAGLAAAPIVSAQTPRSPADPASPGAVVTPQHKAVPEMQKKNDGAGNTGGSSSGVSPLCTMASRLRRVRLAATQQSP